jgi:hypothetical protein
VSATYVTQASCPVCALYQNGCYGENGRVGKIGRRLQSTDSPLEIAQEEADCIHNLSGKRPLRVHVLGDCKTDDAALIVSQAMLDHQAKQSQPAWTYTHSWRDIDRASWHNVYVQASCETAEEVAQANARGYATALVVEKFESKRLYTTQSGARVIPCLEQVGLTPDCMSCRLCLGPSIEKRRELGISIGFATHGSQKKKAAAALARIAAWRKVA